MDVAKYSYECQTILHYGLRYAKGRGHDYLEVEHVALAAELGDRVLFSQGDVTFPHHLAL